MNRRATGKEVVAGNSAPETRKSRYDREARLIHPEEWRNMLY